MDEKKSVCPRCGGKKNLKLNLGPHASNYVKCHVCSGAGAVPFESIDPQDEKKQEAKRAAAVDAAQSEMFDVAALKRARL